MLIGYARVSTLDQNPDLQTDALKKAGCERIFTDRLSGALVDRPALAEGLGNIRKGDTLVVWRLDRLARSVVHLIEIVKDLESRGGAFTSLTEAIDTRSSGGKLVFHIFGALAEFERSLIRERTTAGLKAARDRGRVGGRPRLMTGQKLSAARKLIGSGMTVREVADALHISIPTIYRHLCRRGSSH